MSWLKGVVKDLTKGKAGSGPLTGKTVKVQSYLVKVENVLGEGGFATIYRCSDNTTKAAFALKHFRLRCGGVRRGRAGRWAKPGGRVYGRGADRCGLVSLLSKLFCVFLHTPHLLC